MSLYKEFRILSNTISTKNLLKNKFKSKSQNNIQIPKKISKFNSSFSMFKEKENILIK